MICYYYEQPTFLIFSNDVPGLLYYSHLPVSIIALMVGFFVLLSAPKQLLNRLLFYITLCFAMWAGLNLITWTNIDSGTLLFAWSLLGIIQGLLSILCIYLVTVFLTQKDVGLLTKSSYLILLAPVLLFAPSIANLSGFDVAECDAFKYEGLPYVIYYTALGLLAIIWISILAIKHYIAETDTKKRAEIVMMSVGVSLFLFTFFFIVFLAAYLVEPGIMNDSSLELYGMFGMPIFMMFIGILIVRSKTFKVTVLAPTALIMTMAALTASQFTYIRTQTGQVLTVVTLVLVVVSGLLLIRSVRKEIKQREQLEQLTTKLEKANVRLKTLDKQKSEFVSIASHQLRSPLTSIRGYASMLIESSFGPIPEKAKEPLQRIETSAKRMVLAVEDYLNVSRIESGNMKYELTDFNLKDEIEKICDDVRPTALKAGLVLLFRSNLQSKAIVHADVGKTAQMAHNLINNSIKYNPRGSITVFIRDDVRQKQVYVDVIDTGVGMSQDTIDILFQKFSRADGANKVNTTGTGLGLFVAHKMAEAMGGDITAHSEGEGKGSRFTLTLPLEM
jgi:signal transduction histidine kinase